jgi:hypothetical protein
MFTLTESSASGKDYFGHQTMGLRSGNVSWVAELKLSTALKYFVSSVASITTIHYLGASSFLLCREHFSTE